MFLHSRQTVSQNVEAVSKTKGQQNTPNQEANKKGEHLCSPLFTVTYSARSRRYLLQLRLTIFTSVTVRWPCSFGLSCVLSLAFSFASCILSWFTVPLTRTLWPTWSARLALSPFNSPIVPLSAISSYPSPSFCPHPVHSQTLSC